MHEKRRRNRQGCRPGLRSNGFGQVTGRAGSVGACVAVGSAAACVRGACPKGKGRVRQSFTGSNRAAPGGLAVTPAASRVSKRAERGGLWAGVNIRFASLDAGRSA
jgi:hypothetical protein